jgi:hypothetical protein
MNMPSTRVFELGIVMAGAISAGAYSAGVMNFLMEALDAYEDAKRQDGWDGPVHDVRIPVMTGASARGHDRRDLGVARFSRSGPRLAWRARSSATGQPTLFELG